MPTNVGGVPLGELNLGVPTAGSVSVHDRLVVDGLVFNQTIARAGSFSYAVVSNLKFNQTLLETTSIPFTDDLGLDDSWSYTKGNYINQKINFNPIVKLAMSYTQNTGTPYSPYQTLSYNVTYNLSVTSELNWTDALTQHIVEGVYNTLAWNQAIVVTVSTPLTSELEWLDSVTYIKTGGLNITHTLEFSDTVTVVKTKRYRVLQALGYAQNVKQFKVVNRTFVDTLDWTQEIRREVFPRTIEDTLAFVDTVTYTPVYHQSVISTLEFNQTISQRVAYTRHIISDLIFYPTRQVYIGMGDVAYYTIDNIQHVVVPRYAVGKKNVPHCILQVPNAAITMPAPEWGDTENYGGVFTIKRSMNGIPYTHVRSLSLRKLKLPWVVAKRKAWELREFLIQHNAELITLTTWKGDKWFVNLTTNPFELAVRGRYDKENEKVSIELEFEGLKVM